MKENKTKKSQLVWDPKIGRKLLKMNDAIKFCPYCGKPVADGCECHKNIVVDVKPYRGADNVIVPDRSVLVFDNNSTFQADYAQLIEEVKVKKEAESEQVEADID